MGIAGLLQYLSTSLVTKHISSYAHKTLAIDGYYLLHRASYCCSKPLVLGEPTSNYLVHCLKFLSSLLNSNIKPFLVFDGRSLPSKDATDLNRRKTRQIAKDQAIELLQAGDSQAANRIFPRAVSVTNNMVMKLVFICKKLNISVMRAPYEADAQIAFLVKNHVVDGVLAEDSDFIIWGMDLILFKFKLENGYLEEFDSSRLNVFHPSFSELQEAAILSGCDYLPNPPGIGIKTAIKYRSGSNTVFGMIKALKSQGKIDNDYICGYIKALITFNCQMVYDPFAGECLCLNDYNEYVRSLYQKCEFYPEIQELLDNLNLFSGLPDFLGIPMTKEVVYGVSTFYLDPKNFEIIPKISIGDVEIQMLLKSKNTSISNLLSTIKSSQSSQTFLHSTNFPRSNLSRTPKTTIKTPIKTNGNFSPF
ncbi:hypothetical protein GEMRC1_001954 [Eukaryota sp. GEM-RC1]